MMAAADACGRKLPDPCQVTTRADVESIRSKAALVSASIYSAPSRSRGRRQQNLLFTRIVLVAINRTGIAVLLAVYLGPLVGREFPPLAARSRAISRFTARARPLRCAVSRTVNCPLLMP